jgi:hypothetical protein
LPGMMIMERRSLFKMISRNGYARTALAAKFPRLLDA